MTMPNSKSSRPQIKITSVYHTCHISIQGSDSSQLPPQLNAIFSFSQQQKLTGCLRYDSSDTFQMFMGKWIMQKYLCGMNHAKKVPLSILYWGSWWWQAHQSNLLYQSSLVLLFHMYILVISVTNLLITSILLSWKSCIWIPAVEN